MIDLLDVSIYTDGACSGNPGPGGWAALILVKKGKERKGKVTIKGGEKHTTNNRMELMAIIKALTFIQENLKNYKFNIRVTSDSSYVVDSINNGRLLTWQKNGWKTTRDTKVVNRDLWEKLVQLDDHLSPSFIRVKGHNGNKFNEYVDQIAVKESNKYKQVLKGL